MNTLTFIAILLAISSITSCAPTPLSPKSGDLAETEKKRPDLSPSLTYNRRPPSPPIERAVLPKPAQEKVDLAIRLIQAIYSDTAKVRLEPGASRLQPAQSDAKLRSRFESIGRRRGDVSFTFDEVADDVGTSARIQGTLRRKDGTVSFNTNEPQRNAAPIHIHLLGNFGNPGSPGFVLHYASDGGYEYFQYQPSTSEFAMMWVGGT